MSRFTIDLPEDQQDDPEVLGTELTTKFVLGALREHGFSSLDELEEAREKDLFEPVTLGELRDWLGY